MQLQLLLFEKTFEEKVLERLDKMEESLNKIRKAQFAQISEIRKIVYDLKFEHEYLQKALCDKTNYCELITK